jgi:hypothetical protein
MLSRFGRRITAAAAVLAALWVSGCEKVPLGAPSESFISVAAGASSLPPGGSTEITAFVVEQAGTPVHNGTLVRFTASLGTVNPVEVETRNGFATTTFTAANASGVARIRATSGSATGGTGDAPSNLVEIAVGGAAANAVLLTATPSRVPPGGGIATLTAAVVDESGNRLTGIPVTFTTTAGVLSASSATTDVGGNASVQLTTDREATVTATAGGKNSTTKVEVGAGANVTLALSPPSGSVTIGTPIALTVTPAAGTAPRVTVEWGDGRSDSLGVVTAARTVAHNFAAPGSYIISAIATADGATSTTQVPATVTARPPLSVTVSGPTTSPAQCTTVTFTANTAPAGELVASYEWTIDSSDDADDAVVTTTGNQLTRLFKRIGTKTVTVVATTPDGRQGNGQTQVTVLAGTTTCG